jgi:transposase
MKTAGIDVGKLWLDAAVDGGDTMRVSNDKAGIETLIGWFREQAVERVGLEASGGYEREARLRLAGAGFATVLHQPLEVRLFVRLSRQRAKNDRLDAKLIAAATAALDTPRPAPSPRLVELCEHLTVYEQVTAKAAELKTFLSTVRQQHLRDGLEVQLAQLKALKQTLMCQLIAAIKADEELAARFRLLSSLPGIGPINAASLVLRMPELGRLEHGQAASLIGVAPFDHDSGQYKGTRFISGGRSRPRRMLYLAALAAKRSDPTFKRFVQHLIDRGKAKKVAIVALMRKLIEAANLVLKRNTPWIKATQSDMVAPSPSAPPPPLARERVSRLPAFAGWARTASPAKRGRGTRRSLVVGAALAQDRQRKTKGPRFWRGPSQT